jgi:hypothetical protein
MVALHAFHGNRMNFVPIIRFTRKAWRFITVPLSFCIALAAWCVGLFFFIFLFVLAYTRGKRLPLTV